MKSFAWALLLLSLMATFLQGGVMADDVEVNDEEEAAAPAEDDTYEDEDYEHEVSTSYHIPEYPDGRLPVGKEFTILVDFSNKGQDVFNVTKVVAFLHSPFDLSYFIQNFTAKPVSGVAAPSAQVSLEYKVKPDEKLEPLEYWLSGYVEYTMEGFDEPYQHMFVNTTIELYESRGVDFGSMFTTFLMMAVIGAGAYFSFSSASVKVTGKKKKKFVPRAGPTDDDWGVEAYKQTDRRTGRKNKKVSKK